MLITNKAFKNQYVPNMLLGVIIELYALSDSKNFIPPSNTTTGIKRVMKRFFIKEILLSKYLSLKHLPDKHNLTFVQDT